VAAFDTVFQLMGASVIRAPFRAPNANAYAERWIHSVRREWLNKLISLNQAHLRQVLHKYLTYHNSIVRINALTSTHRFPISPCPQQARCIVALFSKGLFTITTVLLSLLHDLVVLF
jgi:hypothetical protein